MLALRTAPRTVCQRCERAARPSRPISTSSAARAAPGPSKAQSKARTLPESAAAPFSLQPAVVEAAFANARRRKFPVHETEWRAVLERARAEVPKLAEEIASLKKALSRDPRKAKGRAASSAETSAEIGAADPAALKARLRALAAEHDELLASSLDVRLRFPNGTHSSVPEGPEPNARIVAMGDPLGLLPQSVWTTLQEHVPCAIGDLPSPLSSSAAEPRPAHTDIAAELPHALYPASSALDQASGALTTGASFPFLLGPLAALSHALSAYALRICATHGFLLVRAPDVIKADLARRCGFMPRDEGEASQTYFVHSGGHASPSGGGGGGAAGSPELCLAGTAEIPLAGLCADRTFFLNGGKGGAAAPGGGPFLPLKLCALGSAFRAEAGARGADTKGLYRVHQFDKVEMFVVAPAKAGDAAAGGDEAGAAGGRAAESAQPFAAEDADMAHLEELRAIQEAIVSGLGLPYRVLDMPTEELGASACRKYDIEAWMPGRGSWGEISSASHCTTFQSRRLNIRYRRSPGAQGKLEYAHTLNATAAAMPRLIVALLENFGTAEAREGGTSGPRLRLPAVLRPHWIGEESGVEWVDVVSVPSS